MTRNDTYGSGPAAAMLAQIMDDQHQWVRSKASKLFHGTTKGFKEIAKLEEKELRIYILTIFREKKFAEIDTKPWQIDLKHFMKNVLTMHYRLYLKR